MRVLTAPLLLTTLIGAPLADALPFAARASNFQEQSRTHHQPMAEPSEQAALVPRGAPPSEQADHLVPRLTAFRAQRQPWRQLPERPCHSYPCMNGGTCHQFKDHFEGGEWSFACRCAAGFGGECCGERSKLSSWSKLKYTVLNRFAVTSTEEPPNTVTMMMMEAPAPEAGAVPEEAEREEKPMIRGRLSEHELVTRGRLSEDEPVTRGRLSAHTMDGPTVAGESSRALLGGAAGMGPAWTRGEAEAPAGKQNMGTWVGAVYTAEQQARMGVDASGTVVLVPAGEEDTDGVGLGAGGTGSIVHSDMRAGEEARTEAAAVSSSLKEEDLR